MTAVSPTAPVSLGDLKDDPIAAMQRIGASLKRDVSDPKFWVGIAASYFAPKVADAALPVVARAAAGMKAAAGEVLTPAMAKDAATMLGGDSRVDAGVRIASRLAGATRAARTSADVPTSAAPAAAPPEISASPAAAEVPQSAPAPAAKGLTRNDLLLDERNAFDRLTKAGEAPADVLKAIAQHRAATAPPSGPTPTVPLSKAEADEYFRLVKSGKSGKVATKLVLDQRALAARLNLPTAEDARRAVVDRNDSGRWQDPDQ